MRKCVCLSLFALFLSICNVSAQQKYFDAMAFDGLVNGIWTNMKECKLTYEHFGGLISFMMNSSETYNFNSIGQLTNAEELKITNIQRNSEGYIISYSSFASS